MADTTQPFSLSKADIRMPHIKYVRGREILYSLCSSLLFPLSCSLTMSIIALLLPIVAAQLFAMASPVGNSSGLLGGTIPLRRARELSTDGVADSEVMEKVVDFAML